MTRRRSRWPFRDRVRTADDALFRLLTVLFVFVPFALLVAAAGGPLATPTSPSAWAGRPRPTRWAGLVLALGLTERRRTFAILEALGANRRQLGGFLWSEGLFILVGGLVAGVLLGFGVAQTLVKVLTGVFDAPPTSLGVPWAYLGVLFSAAVVSAVVAVVTAGAAGRRPVVEELRNI